MSAPEAASATPEVDTCSAKRCTRAAQWALRWNNPRLHTPERRKVWLACDEHRTSLSEFLGARGFLKDVVPHAHGDRPEGDQPDDERSAADR